MRDTLPLKPLKNEAIVINLDDYYGDGTHWVAIRKIVGRAVYFDSFGDLPPPKDVLRYLQGTKVFYNYQRFQSSPVECGHLCLEFLCMLNPFSLILKSIN